MNLVNKINNLKIADRLKLGFGIVITLVLTSNVLAFWMLTKNKQIVEDMNAVRTPTLSIVSETRSVISESKLLIKNWVFIEQKTGTHDKLKLVKIHQETYPLLKKQIASLKSQWTQDEQKSFSLLQKQIDTLFQYHSEVMKQLSTMESYQDLMVTMTVTPMVDESGSVTVLTDKIMAGLDAFINNVRTQNKKTTTSMSSSLTFFQNFLIVMALFIIVTILVTSFLTIRSINRPIMYLKNIIVLMSQGILPKDKIATSNDEIGEISHALNNMIEKLKTIVSEIKQGAGQVVAASHQMAGSSRSLSKGVDFQAASVEEISASMEEMLSAIQQNADNAHQTEKIAVEASTNMEHSTHALLATVTSMQQIAAKTSIIDDIATKTDLLAINAAIEAARAGEHGKGFAVVALEVRKLAEHSKRAAQEINKFTQSSVEASEKSGVMMTDLLPSIKHTSSLVQEIAASSMEQNNGINQINSSVQQLNTLTQQAAATAEEMSASSEELANHAKKLNSIISFFKIGQSEDDKIDELTQQAASLLKAVEQLKKNKQLTADEELANAIKEVEAQAHENQNKTNTETIENPIKEEKGILINITDSNKSHDKDKDDEYINF